MQVDAFGYPSSRAVHFEPVRYLKTRYRTYSVITVVLIGACNSSTPQPPAHKRSFRQNLCRAIMPGRTSDAAARMGSSAAHI